MYACNGANGSGPRASGCVSSDSENASRPLQSDVVSEDTPGAATRGGEANHECPHRRLMPVNHEFAPP